MSSYEISKSSLLSLKAEIIRKREELVKVNAENVAKIQTIKKNTPLEFKRRENVDGNKLELTAEEEDLLKKSRTMLEAKSRLYDKLAGGSSKNVSEREKEFNQRYLVRFDKKTKGKSTSMGMCAPGDSDDEMDFNRYPESDEERHFSDEYEPATNPNEEWVEYVDCLGRTRKCLRIDLASIKANDAELKETVLTQERERRGKSQKPPEPKDEVPENLETPSEQELLSPDMRRETLRKQWEKEEEKLKNKDKIHYQDILFNEARTHGVGYYGFSKDEEERRKQQEALNKIRQETEQQQKKSQDLKSLREKQLAARLQAARNRKRARLGLEPEEEPPQEPVKESDAQIQEKLEEEARQKEIVAKEKLLEEARNKHIRPWDKGKKNAPYYEYSQEEWVDKKRKERNKEFAPPSTSPREFRSKDRYFEEAGGNSLKFTTKKPIVNELEDLEEEIVLRTMKKKGAEVPPPDYYGPEAKKSREKSKNANIEDSIEAGLQFLRKQVEKKSVKNKQDDIFLD